MFVRHVAVLGAGYVGLTTGACLASLGHRMVCADIDAAKIDRLRTGGVPVREGGLAELVVEGITAGRLSFAVGAAAAVKELDNDGAPAEAMFLCVPTPMGGSAGSPTSAPSWPSSRKTRDLLPVGCVVANKSTVRWARRCARPSCSSTTTSDVVSNPEFLREGSAVHSDRIVVGSNQQDAAERVAALYARLGAPTVLTDVAKPR